MSASIWTMRLGLGLDSTGSIGTIGSVILVIGWHNLIKGKEL